VRLGVEGRVLVDLDDADRVVVQMLLEPLRLDEHVVRIIGHAGPPRKSSRLLAIYGWRV